LGKVKAVSSETVISAKPAAGEQEEGIGMAPRPAKSNNITNHKDKHKRKEDEEEWKEKRRDKRGEGKGRRIDGRDRRLGEGGTRNRDLIGVSLAWIDAGVEPADRMISQCPGASRWQI
jgi:hypothetical protein